MTNIDYKGLPYNFVLTAGKFTLTEGESKVQINLWTFMKFMNWFRVYKEDYCIDSMFLLQKPISFIDTYKTFFLAKLTSSLKKYLPELAVRSLNMYNSKSKSIQIAIEYTTKISDNVEPSYSVTFINSPS